MPTRIEADYLIETAYDPLKAAEAMAGEQSSGTFVAVPGETPELKQRSAARVESLQIEDAVDAPSLPGAGRPKGTAATTIRRATVTLSWPLDNIGPSLPNLMATVAGNLFELQQFSGLRLLDLRLPDPFCAGYRGPRFGIDGTRRLSGVEGRPLIGTIIKPSIGLDAAETAALVDVLCGAGIDFIKDDELQSDGARCPFEARVNAVMGVINAHAQRSGKRVMFAFNVTGEIDQMRRRHDLVLKQGGTCVMASLNSIGLVGIADLARHTQLPLHGHRNGWGYLTRHPLLGWSFTAWQKLWRLAGVDHLHVNGIANKFSESDESVMASALACLTPLFEGRPCLAMPVFSSGQTIRQAAATYAGLRSVDLIYAAGGGIMAHPDGVAAGVAALRQAWEAAVAGVPLAEAAEMSPALSHAMDAYA
jgi:ribulose-bisphosphate carboxylase large chain